MSTRWITAWIISVFCYMAAYFALRRSGLSRFDALMLAVPFFPSPLMIALGGSNSFIYLIDVTTPVMCLTAWKRWQFSSPWPKRLALALAVGAGLVPLFVTAFFSGDRGRLLYAMVNAYRTLGSAALIVIGSSVAVSYAKANAFKDGQALVGVSLTCAVLAVALVLQYMGWIDSNVFYGWIDSASTSNTDMGGFAVAGLFRASLGIVGVMGVCVFLATRGDRGFLEICTVIGAVAGFAIIVIVGSKTSLAIAVVLMLVGLIRAIRSGARKVVYAVVLLGILAGVGACFINRLPERYVRLVFGTLRGDRESMQTYEVRAARWEQAFDVLGNQPEILVGAGLEQGAVIHLGWYHNEYLSLLMNGGVFSFGPYMFFLAGLGWSLWRSVRADRPVVVFAGLLFVGSLVQAITVMHIVPGLFYPAISGMLSICYGLSLSPASCEEQAPWANEYPAYAVAQHTF